MLSNAIARAKYAMATTKTKNSIITNPGTTVNSQANRQMVSVKAKIEATAV